MHIAFLNPHGNFDPQDSHWSEHPDFGGQLVYVKEVATAMAAQGHQIDILTRQIIDRKWPEFAAPLAHYADIKNVNIVRIPCGPKKFLTKENLWPYIGSEWVPNILNFYASIGVFPDAISAHYGNGGLAAVLLSQKISKPFTFTGRSLCAQKMDKLKASSKNIRELENSYCLSPRLLAERVSMNYAGRVIVSTQQERLEQYSHNAYRGAIEFEDKTRFAVIPPGVNQEVFSPDRTEMDLIIRDRIKAARKRDLSKERRKLPLVLTSSRLDSKKNIVGVVKAFAYSKKLLGQANIALVVRGLDDPIHDYASLSTSEKAVMDEIIAIIDEHNLWDAVTAFSLDSQNELAAAYRVLAKRKSVFALTTYYEPFGLAPLEAMSCGLPTVVTQNGGPAESLIEGKKEFGVLVDPTNPRDIARGILQVLESPQRWKKIADAGIVRVNSKYTWDSTADGYLQIITELVKQRSSQGNLDIPAWYTRPTKKNEISLDTLSQIYFRK